MIDMSKRKKILFVVFFVFIDLFLLYGFIVIRNATEENKLKKEVRSLIELDITKDRYDRPIKTKGNYALIEKTIKKYLDNYAVRFQRVLAVTSDSQFIELLSVDNYSNDGPEFVASLQYIDEKQKQFNEDIDQLIENCDEDKIKKYIDEVIDNHYYVKLYQDLMLDKDMSKDFVVSKQILEDQKKKINLIFDTSRETFQFLKNSNNDWEISDGQIKLRTTALVDQYNNLVNKIK